MKPWYQSTTIWFNLALLVVAFVPQVAAVIPIPQEVLDFVAFVGNILLRFRTVQGITLQK